MATNDGGPAFPILDIGNTQCEGLSIRDYFAAKALAAQIGHDATLISIVNGAKECEVNPHTFAAMCAYRYADAMLAAREVQP